MCFLEQSLICFLEQYTVAISGCCVTAPWRTTCLQTLTGTSPVSLHSWSVPVADVSRHWRGPVRSHYTAGLSQSRMSPDIDGDQSGLITQLVCPSRGCLQTLTGTIPVSLHSWSVPFADVSRHWRGPVRSHYTAGLSQSRIVVCLWCAVAAAIVTK